MKNAVESPECSQCGKDFLDKGNAGKYLVTLSMEGYRPTTSLTFEKLENMDVEAKEVLCSECFDKFADAFAGIFKE